MTVRKPDVDKYCVICGKKIQRNRLSSGRIEDYSDYLRRKHCNRICMGKNNKPRGQKPFILLSNGYVAVLSLSHPRKNKWNYINKHILDAEKVLGKPLPENAVVHHHTKDQLVVCENNAYHMLIHQRQRAYEVCKNAGWRKCKFCKKYDSPNNLYINNNNVYHKNCCRIDYDRKKYGEKNNFRNSLKASHP